MIEQLLQKFNFDVTILDNQLLEIEHPREPGGAPLVVVSNPDGYRVSQAVYVNGKLKPANSVSFDREGQPIGGTTLFGASEDPQLAWNGSGQMTGYTFGKGKTRRPNPL